MYSLALLKFFSGSVTDLTGEMIRLPIKMYTADRCGIPPGVASKLGRTLMEKCWQRGRAVMLPSGIKEWSGVNGQRNNLTPPANCLTSL
jgi:hypothetical protein